MAFGAAILFQCNIVGFNSLNCLSSPKLPRLFIHRRKYNFNSSNSVVGIRLSAVFANSKTPIREAAEAQLEEDINTFSPSSATTSSGWSVFAEKVSGEWDGFGADFSKEGEPIELPESVVPEAYREWDVKVFDWQTQCPTLAHPTHHSQLMYKLIKLLPTVGCEADAATKYSVLERNINDSNTVVAFAYQSSGCYVAVWQPVAAAAKASGSVSLLLELEHCLVDPRDKESRVRIIQAVSAVVKEKLIMMQLEGIQVFCEQWYGPFRNGEQLGGCAIRDSAFASTQALKTSQVTGVWQGLPAAIASFHQDYDSQLQEENVIIRELVVVDAENVPKPCSRDGSGLILLPKQLWCSSNQEKPGETCFQVGWLLDDGLAITSKCSFSADAKLKEIAIGSEKMQRW
ncbi:hypothetical protein ACH5RR_002522 [Cinchona calisaya]|uniref:Uncharacterized protein n=1 Tax=Cinchona calisaya TaxID=153742 RepID=A0ABD3B6S8_9GENT